MSRSHRRTPGGAPCRAAALITLFAAPLTPSAARAQHVVSTLDLGAARYYYAESLSAAGVVVSPTVRLDWAQATLTASGTGSQLGRAGWTTQGALDASVFTPVAGPLLGELAGMAGGTAGEDAMATGQAAALARVHLAGARKGAWGGGGAGRSWDGALWRATRVAEAGAWARFGTATANASVTPTVVDDTLRYTDATIALRTEVARVEISASLGTRAGRLPAYATVTRTWGGISAAGWMSSRVAVVAAAGSFPVDLGQGFPGGRYLTLSLRIGSRDARARVPAASRLRAPTPTGGVLAFRLERTPGGERVVRVRAPAAASVELAGDFNGWQPVALARGPNGWWTTTIRVPRGTHQVNLRLDGREWIAPPGIPTVGDEFGGMVGLLEIP